MYIVHYLYSLNFHRFLDQTETYNLHKLELVFSLNFICALSMSTTKFLDSLTLALTCIETKDSINNLHEWINTLPLHQTWQQYVKKAAHKVSKKNLMNNNDNKFAYRPKIALEFNSIYQFCDLYVKIRETDNLQLLGSKKTRSIKSVTASRLSLVV